MRGPLLVVAICLASCSADHGRDDSGAIDAGLLEDAVRPTDTVRAPTGKCQGWWFPGPLPAEGPGVKAGKCAATLTHDPWRIYDDCEPPSDGPGRDNCGVPTAGGVFCTGNGQLVDGGHLTETCRVQADCPPTFGCLYDGRIQDATGGPTSYGQCEQLCARDEDCSRCGMKCGDGYCQYPRPDPRGNPCRADCDCFESICYKGYCRRDIMTVPLGLCGVPGGGDCSCSLGECINTCCIQADGSIAYPGDLACEPPEGCVHRSLRCAADSDCCPGEGPCRNGLCGAPLHGDCSTDTGTACQLDYLCGETSVDSGEVCCLGRGARGCGSDGDCCLDPGQVVCQKGRCT